MIVNIDSGCTSSLKIFRQPDLLKSAELQIRCEVDLGMNMGSAVNSLYLACVFSLNESRLILAMKVIWSP